MELDVEKFLDNSGHEPEYFAGQVFGEFAYPRKVVLAILEDYKKQCVKTLEEEIRIAYRYGQGNATMMEAGLERDEVDDHVNYVMTVLKNK